MDMPNFVKREIEKLEEIIAPLLKKASKYTLFSLPLVFFSTINLFVLLFFSPTGQFEAIPIFICAAIGAIGMALSKEAKIQRVEIQSISSDYIIERIKKSEIASDRLKKEYISLVQKQPLLSTHHFITFLQKEVNQANDN